MHESIQKALRAAVAVQVALLEVNDAPIVDAVSLPALKACLKELTRRCKGVEEALG